MNDRACWHSYCPSPEPQTLPLEPQTLRASVKETPGFIWPINFILLMIKLRPRELQIIHTYGEREKEKEEGGGGSRERGKREERRVGEFKTEKVLYNLIQSS